jgi:hypothetical protein
MRLSQTKLVLWRNIVLSAATLSTLIFFLWDTAQKYSLTAHIIAKTNIAALENAREIRIMDKKIELMSYQLARLREAKR